MEIKSTKNYSQFQTIAGNRRIDEGHLKRLATSILSNNLLCANPIIVNDRMEVIDGQHRLEVAKQNNLDIFYIVVSTADLHTVQKLNNHKKNWMMWDYIESFSAIGNPHYIALGEYCRNFDLSPSAGIEIMGLDTHNVRSTFKDGKFQIKDMKEAIGVGELLIQIRPYCDQNILRSRDFVRAVRYLYLSDSVDKSRLVAKLAQSNARISRCISQKDYLRHFDDIYNFKVKSGFMKHVF